MDELGILDRVERMLTQHEEIDKEKFKEIEAKILAIEHIQTEVLNTLIQIRGAAKVFQFIFYVLGPLVTAGYWLKDHFR